MALRPNRKPKNDRLQIRLNAELKQEYITALEFDNRDATDHITAFIEDYVHKMKKVMANAAKSKDNQ